MIGALPARTFDTTTGDDQRSLAAPSECPDHRVPASAMSL
jgi:hypothetical protein